MRFEEEKDVQLQVQCRDGPLRQRKFTDCFCCFLYVILLAGVLTLALVANTAPRTRQQKIDRMFYHKGKQFPFLSAEQQLPYIITSLGIGAGICLLVAITTFVIPTIAAYIFIPLGLFGMLFLGGVFLFRYFGNHLPLLTSQFQKTFVTKYSLLTLAIGLSFIIGFIISLIIILMKQQRIKFIVASLCLAKACFWDNVYLIGLPILLSAISIGMCYLNLVLIRFGHLQRIREQVVNRWLVVYLVVFQLFWTHGFLQALSDFIYQSIAIHWYYNSGRHQQEDYSGFSQNFIPSLKLTFKHMGTIVFGSIISYYPQSFNTAIHQCEEKYQGCYNLCCCCHKLILQKLSKYCFMGTIMYSYPFMRASSSTRALRASAKHTFPQLYMVGNFYITIIKIFVVFTTVIICYFFIIHNGRFTGFVNLIGPLLITLLASMEISNHFMNTTGLIGDTLYLTYVLDFNCETTNFGNLNADHCPRQAYDVINEAKIGRYAVYD